MVSLRWLRGLGRQSRQHHAGEYADKLEAKYEKAQITHPLLVGLVTLVLAAGILLVLILVW